MNTNTKKEKPAWLQAIGGDKLVLILAIVLVFVLFTALNKNFLSTTNLVNILVAASLVGLFNAWMVNAINIEAFIATLVTQMIVRGLALATSVSKALRKQSLLCFV